MWKPPDALRRRWVDNDFRLEFVAMEALVSGDPHRAGLDTYEARVDLRGFDTPPAHRAPDKWRTIRRRRLDRIDFTYARLANLRFERVQFTDCVFDRADIEGGRFQDCTLRNCSFRRADLLGCSLGDFCSPHHWMPSSWEDCSFVSATLTSAFLLGSRFSRCDFSQARMKQSTWVGVEFVDCVFAGEIREAEFRSDYIGNVPPRHQHDMLDSVDWSATSLRWVKICGQNLKHTRLPVDADHLVAADYRCFLENLAMATRASDTAAGRLVQELVPKWLAEMGPDQRIGVFNLKDWLSRANTADEAEIRQAFDTASARCSGDIGGKDL